MHIIQPRWIVHADDKGRDVTIYSLSIHPDGTRLATAGLDSRVKVWSVEPIISADVESDAAKPKLLSTLVGHGGAVLCTRWSATGRYLASSSDDHVVMIWERDVSGTGGKVFGSTDVNVEAYRVAKRLAGHTSDVAAVAWSTDDAFLATGSFDATVLIYDTRNFQMVKKITDHTGFVKGIVWDPVGQYLATQSDDKSVRIWRTTDWGLEKSITEPFVDSPTASFSMRLGWSPDGTHIITPNATNEGVFVSSVIDRSAQWDARISLVGHPNVVEVTAFNPLVFLRDANKPVEGKNLCTLLALAARSSVSLWVTARSRPLVVLHDIFERDILDLAWSADGTQLFASSSEGHVAVLVFKLDELPPVAPAGTAEDYHATFGFVKPVRSAFLAPTPQLSIARQIRAPSPQKTTMVNGKRRIQPSFIAHLDSVESTPEPSFAPLPRPAPVPTAHAAAALEARMGGGSIGGFASISGFAQPTQPPALMPPPPSPSVSPRKRKASTALLLGPDEDAGPSRLPPAHPRGSKSRAPGQNIEWTSVEPRDVTTYEEPREWEPMSLDEIALEVPAVKSFGSVRMSGGVEGEEERLEWRNYAGTKEPTEIVQLAHDKATPLWLDYLPSQAVAGVLNSSFGAIACLDGSIVTYSMAGRHILPVIALDAPPAFIDSAGAYLLVVTASGRLHVWNVLKSVAAFDSLSLRSLLVSPEDEDSLSIVSATVRPNGHPVLALTDGNTLTFNAALRAWTRLSATPWWARSSDLWETRARGKTLAATRGVVRHLEGTINDLVVSGRLPSPDDEDAMDVEGEPAPRIGEGKADFAAATALGHAEARMASAISLASPVEYRQFLMAYASRIAEEGFRAKGDELIRELLGPVYYKPSASETWSPTILGVPKRDLLREVLNIFVKSTALKKLALENQDLLRKISSEE